LEVLKEEKETKIECIDCQESVQDYWWNSKEDS